MSTCPDDDLHHLYVDDEIPPEYLNAYKSHADSCAQCRKKIQHITALRNVFKDDAAHITLSSDQIDESYNRLITTMRYRSVSRAIQKNDIPFVFRQTLPWAAAVVILISGAYFFLHTNSDSKRQNFITATQTERGAEPLQEESAAIAITSGMTEGYNLQTAGVMTQVGALPYIPNIDVFRPSFVYASAETQHGQRIYISGVISFSLSNTEHSTGREARDSSQEPND